MSGTPTRRLNPDGILAALQAHHDHKADPGRKGCGIEKAIVAYLEAHPNPTEELVARLRSDAAQLIRMSKATEFGKDMEVRVKAPDLLIASLVEAADRLSLLSAEVERLEGQLDLVSGQMRYIAKSNATNFERAEALSAKLKAAEAALERIGGIKYSDVDTIYAHRAMIDYARDQARTTLQLKEHSKARSTDVPRTEANHDN